MKLPAASGRGIKNIIKYVSDLLDSISINEKGGGDNDGIDIICETNVSCS